MLILIREKQYHRNTQKSHIKCLTTNNIKYVSATNKQTNIHAKGKCKYKFRYHGVTFLCVYLLGMNLRHVIVVYYNE